MASLLPLQGLEHRQILFAFDLMLAWLFLLAFIFSCIEDNGLVTGKRPHRCNHVKSPGHVYLKAFMDHSKVFVCSVEDVNGMLES